MPPRIAVPMPHSSNREYSERAISQYERAVSLAGGIPVRIQLDQITDDLRKVVENCNAVLLPGSPADVDPSRFTQQRSSHTAAADTLREQIDALLLNEAYSQHKPILGICYGLQSLNVHRGGSLIQHIPEFVGEVHSKVDHEAGKNVAVAHTVDIGRNSRLAQIVTSRSAEDLAQPKIVVPVNSSHHQCADTVGEGLAIVARCPDDGIIEALEGTAPDHFVLSVQWHPERSVDQDEPSRAIFRAFVAACE